MKTWILFLVIALLSCSVFGQESNGDKKLRAKSFLNQKAPELVVEKWLTGEPDLKGKFVLIDFWGTKCGPCKRGIPDLNEFSKQFKDDLVVIGLCSQTEEQVRAMKDPVIEYYNAIDTKKVMMKELNVTIIPHAILIDPQGIVRWEGNPILPGYELSAKIIETLINGYKNYGEGGVREAWWAKSFLGKKAPELIVENWSPKKPNVKGKFILLDFFGVYCAPCRKAIPKLNEWSKQFKKDMIVIGYASNSIEQLKQMEPKIEYYCASDHEGRTCALVDLHVNSFVHLIDPKGIVRWEGICAELTTEKIKEVIEKYK